MVRDILHIKPLCMAPKVLKFYIFQDFHLKIQLLIKLAIRIPNNRKSIPKFHY